MPNIKNFPKIESPFIRKMIGGHYIVTPEIDPEYKWVFQDEGVLAVDKIDGTNICLRIKDGKVIQIFNRKNEKYVFPPSIKQTAWEGACMEGIAKAIQKEWLKGLSDGDYYGELIGELINANPHKLQGHLLVPFSYLIRKCHWRSWIKNQYPKDFDTISEWFKEMPSLFNQTMKLEEVKAEGLVFYHPDGKRMAKLRRDMFDWFKGDRHKSDLEAKETKQ
ncbi:MAG: RNA ligase family protein [Candidatus Kuenenbacteria bacterium]